MRNLLNRLAVANPAAQLMIGIFGLVIVALAGIAAR